VHYLGEIGVHILLGGLNFVPHMPGTGDNWVDHDRFSWVTALDQLDSKFVIILEEVLVICILTTSDN
jgi:hypothetical protein